MYKTQTTLCTCGYSMTQETDGKLSNVKKCAKCGKKIEVTK